MAQAKANGIEFIELPIAFDAFTVVVNNQNNWVTSMTVADLKKIWEPGAQGQINNWNQIRPEWPNEKMALFGAGADSGTFDYFTEAIVGKAKASRGDYTASEDDNVLVQGVEGNKYAFGYLPYAYFAPHSTRMKAVAIEWEKNKVQGADSYRVRRTFWPELTTLFLGHCSSTSVRKKSLDKPAVRVCRVYLKSQPLAKEVKYLPLPDTTYQMTMERVRTLANRIGLRRRPRSWLTGRGNSEANT